MIWFGYNSPQDDCERLVEQRMRVATRILKSDEAQLHITVLKVRVVWRDELEQ